MLVATQTDALSKRIGDRKAVALIARVGYDCVDYSMFDRFDDHDYPLHRSGYEKYLLELRKIAEDGGVFFNQAHAPFPSHRPNDEEYTKMVYPQIVRSIEAAGILGARGIVVHPTHFPKHQKELNLEFYRSLEPYCREFNVKVCIENMFGYDHKKGCHVPNVCSTGAELAEYVDCLDPRYFTVCLDIGHAGLVGETAASMIRTLGHNRLHALHVHDNNLQRDLHTMPYMETLDWDEITSALKEIEYEGEFTLEADNFMFKFPNELLEDASKLMLAVARHLAAKCEAS